MSNHIIPSGRWNILKGKLRSKWGELTEDDFQQIGGNVEKLIGRIQQKTGEARQNIEAWLKDQGYSDELQSAVHEVTRQGARYAGRLANQLKEYSWSDITSISPLFIIASALLVGFALGRISMRTADNR